MSEKRGNIFYCLDLILQQNQEKVKIFPNIIPYNNFPIPYEDIPYHAIPYHSLGQTKSHYLFASKMWEKSLVLAFCSFDEYVCDTWRKPPLLLCIHCYMRSRCMQLLWSWSHICDLIWEFLLICVVRKLVFSSVLIWLFVYASAFNCLLPQSHLICHKPYFNLKEFLFLFIICFLKTIAFCLNCLAMLICAKSYTTFLCVWNLEKS